MLADANRNLLVDSPSSLGLVARSIRNVTGNLEEADTAVKVLYNVCNDHSEFVLQSLVTRG